MGCCELLSKNCIFDILNNFQIPATAKRWLWIAFKKLYLWYSEQHQVRTVIGEISCELLSKNCIFDILNNLIRIFRQVVAVVNCFQKIVSLIFWTTKMRFSFTKSGCELLSKNCIFDILNNLENFSNPRTLLWIAFKKLYLWYSEQRFVFV